MSRIRQRAQQVQIGIKGIIILFVVIAVLFAYFMVPQFKSWVTLTIFPLLGGVGTTVRNVWTVFVDWLVPTRAAMWRLVLIGIIVGIGPLGYLLYMKGFLGFIKLGRQASDDISGIQRTMAVIPHSQPTPPPRPEDEA